VHSTEFNGHCIRLYRLGGKEELRIRRAKSKRGISIYESSADEFALGEEDFSEEEEDQWIGGLDVGLKLDGTEQQEGRAEIEGGGNGRRTGEHPAK
jgi:hypothetical protein